MATLVGTLLDRYRIDAELGRGAMGVVYRASDPKLDRTVAIKTVSLSNLDPVSEQEYRKRFVVEAQAAGRLSHSGIVTIFDVREEPEPFLVMEYVEGQSLQQLINRESRTLPLSTTLRLIQEIAEALQYAHAQGVVHRDIKPANILVSTNGHAKIADFGVAKLNQADLTSPGQVLGSPAFMAPEQLSEEGVDARSDLFSLGVVLYYMLTGHRPFQGNSTTTVCFKLVNHEPLPVSAFESKFSPELDGIVWRAMAKDPEQRYQSGAAMASDIQALRERSGFIEKDVNGTKALQRNSGRKVPGNGAVRAQEIRPRIVVLVGGLLGIALVGATFWSMHGSRRQAGDPVTAEIADHEVRNRGIAGRDSVVHDSSPLGAESKTNPVVISSASHQSTPPVSRHRPTANPAPPRTPPRASSQTTNQTTKTPARLADVPAEAILQIEVEHHFTIASVSVWFDDHLVYQQSLRGNKQRRALVFRRVAGHQFNAIKVPSGRHMVRVRVHSESDSYDQSKIIADASIPGASLLRIVCGDKGEGLQLSLQKE
jgi:serine/threonine protein kinase